MSSSLSAVTEIRGGATTLRCGVAGCRPWLAVETAGHPTERVELPPWSGVGGIELVVSPDERYVAVFLYSGQSSQGYELVALQPVLARVGGLAEIHGHGNAPMFSPDGRWLVSLIDSAPMVRGTGEYFEDIQDATADERVVVDWARLYTQRVDEPEPTRVAVGVVLPRATEVDVLGEWSPYDAVRFAADDVVELRMPWGERLARGLPVQGPITSYGFRTDGAGPGGR